MQAAERAYSFVDFCLQSSDDFNRQRGVAMSITVTISAVRSLRRTLRRWDVEQSPFTVVEIDLCWRRPPLLTKPHGLRSFSLTGAIFSSILSHFTRIQSSRSQYFTSTNHLSCGFYLNVHWRLASKASIFIRPLLIGPTAVTSHAAVNSDARSILISSQNNQIRC